MNESAPLVSIVIPLYNAENYIEETLLSIVNQTYSNYEVIVID
ncbi:glycosyltransferase, partial [Vibrio cholerae]|nr:glycosyltransferase [Vibrio cholerae]